MPPRTSRPASTSTLLPPILALLHPSDPSTTPPNAYSAHQKALTTVARIQGQAPGVAVDICFAVARELLKLDTAAPQEEGEEASKGKTQGQGQGQGEAGSAVELAVKGLGIAEGLEGEGEARMGESNHTHTHAHTLVYIEIAGIRLLRCRCDSAML